MTNLKFFVLAGAIVLALALAAIWRLDAQLGSKPYAGSSEVQRSRAEVVQACNAHVREAELEARAAVDRRATEFMTFIDERKIGVRPFSEEVVSLYGKWRAMKPYLPLTDSEGHRQYVEEIFAKHIFSAAELGGTTERIVIETSKDLESIENRLAVKMRAEISGAPLHSIDVSVAEGELAGAIEQIKSASQWDAGKAGASLAASEVVSVVGTQVLVRLGVSAGFLAAGAANSWWTLGAGIVLGLIADSIWAWIDDPAGDIERETLGAMDKLAGNGVSALQEELGAVVTERTRLWTQAVEKMVP